MLEMGAGYIIGVTGLIGFFLCVRKMEWLLRMIMKACVGIVLIYGCNLLMEYFGMQILVGLNPITIGCSAVLGVPGVVLLYAVGRFV